MSEKTPLLSLPYIQAAQAQKHVTHNEAIELLDAVAQITLEALDVTSPQSTASEGQAWSVGAGATGLWSGYAGSIAMWRGGGWLFMSPRVGWTAWDKTSEALHVWTATGWAIQGMMPDLDNLSGVGINTASDVINKLAVAADATLLTHDGNGHQLKLNKAGISDTASVLYQTNWSGRAEMGLAGNDDFSIKVSADGTSFTDAVRIDAATGAVDMPATGLRQILPYVFRHYLFADKSWTVPTGDGASQLGALNLGTNAEPVAHWSARGIFLPAGSTVHGFKVAGFANSNEVTDIDLRICFQTGPWNTSWNSTAETVLDTLYSQNDAGLSQGASMQKLYVPLAYTTAADGYLYLATRANSTSVLGATRYFYA